MSTSRTYPECPVGRFPSPPRSIRDAGGREIAIERMTGGSEAAVERLVEMYRSFDPADRAQGIPPVREPDIREWLDLVLGRGPDVVARHGAHPVGHATLVPDDEGGHELAIFVHQNDRGQGIGTALLRTLLGAAQADGIDRVWLTVERWNQFAVKLYESVGFEPSGRGRFELEMSIRLLLAPPVPSAVPFREPDPRVLDERASTCAMDLALIDDETLPLSRKSRLPGEGFFVPEVVSEREREAETKAAVVDHDAVVLADPDADGLACVALLREAFGDVALLPTSPHSLDEALAQLGEYGQDDLELYVCDLVADEYDSIAEPLEQLIERGANVTWFDHHRWSDDVADALRATGVRLTVGDAEQECTADVVVRTIEYDFPDHLRQLATVTRDHDLWLKTDPRSDDLADFAYWAEPDEYVDIVSEHGADLPAEVQGFLEERRVEKHDLIDRAVERARFVDIGSWTLGVTYGRCSQNEVAERLRCSGADASVIVKPSGSASIRGTDAFQRCHEVARRFGGGGHPKAAGCKPDIYDDMLDFAYHWVTEGAVTQRAILDAFEELAAEEER